MRAYDLLRMLGRDGNPTPPGHALADYGKIAKTLHLLAMCDPDESYRRTVHTQLTVQESRHRLARKIFHGQRGEPRRRYREGQEDQLGALGLPAKRGRITAKGEQNILGRLHRGRYRVRRSAEAGVPAVEVISKPEPPASLGSLTQFVPLFVSSVDAVRPLAIHLPTCWSPSSQ